MNIASNGLHYFKQPTSFLLRRFVSASLQAMMMRLVWNVELDGQFDNRRAAVVGHFAVSPAIVVRVCSIGRVWHQQEVLRG